LSDAAFETEAVLGKLTGVIARLDRFSWYAVRRHLVCYQHDFMARTRGKVALSNSNK
jgi:hypothetical protein